LRILLALILLLSTFSCGNSDNLLPLTIGNTWTYASNLSSKIVLKVTRKEKVGGVECYVLESSPEQLGKLVAESATEDYLEPSAKMLIRHKRYFMNDNSEMLYQPPQVILHYPLTPGKTWRWKGKQGKKDAEYSFTAAGEETVHALGRNFKCRKLVMTSGKEGEYSSTRWYCPGIGIIKEQTVMSSGLGKKLELNLELMDYDLK